MGEDITHLDSLARYICQHLKLLARILVIIYDGG